MTRCASEPLKGAHYQARPFGLNAKDFARQAAALRPRRKVKRSVPYLQFVFIRLQRNRFVAIFENRGTLALPQKLFHELAKVFRRGIDTRFRPDLKIVVCQCLISP